MMLFCADIRRHSASLLRFPFSTCVQVFSCEIFACLLLDISIELIFYSFLFSSYCCSVDAFAVCVFSGCRSLSFIALFYVFLESSYRCIHAILNIGESSSSFFSWYINRRCHLWDVRPHTSSWVFLFSGPFVEVLLLYWLVWCSFLVLLRESFLNFSFHLRMFNGVHFQYFRG